MTETYELCMHDARQVLLHQLATPDYADSINYTPYKQLDHNGKHV
jgi:Plavaka transposase